MALCGGVVGFVFDRGEVGEASLSAAAMVVAFDPDDDGLAEFGAGAPAFAVEDVLLQQCEERSSPSW